MWVAGRTPLANRLFVWWRRTGQDMEKIETIIKEFLLRTLNENIISILLVYPWGGVKCNKVMSCCKIICFRVLFDHQCNYIDVWCLVTLCMIFCNRWVNTAPLLCLTINCTYPTVLFIYTAGILNNSQCVKQNHEINFFKNILNKFYLKY